MSKFELYFQLGLEHILDVNGYDHILFIISLCSIYLLRDWRRILVLVTAFTIGHSITLALATLDVITIDTTLIEFLIPVTIVITAIANLFMQPGEAQGKLPVNYVFASFFGLIHGMGFSNYLKSLLGSSSSIIVELFAFNIGIEIGQLVIVLTFLVATFLFVTLLGVTRRDWNLIISSAIAGIALTMILESEYL
ncbi:MAG: HupE/UreJ family protein [Cyclobacteriaceae bacterium]